MILISKRSEWCEHAGRIARLAFPGLTWIKGEVGDPMPEIPEGDIISFLCPWVIPNPTPNSINFHPGDEWHPGTGCYNFALHNGAEYFGATCHYMEEGVDSGDIIKRVRFPIFPNDTVETLKFRTMVAMLEMFHKVIVRLAIGKPLRQSNVTWKRKPYTRKELNQLYADFPHTRATTYPDKI